MKKIDRERLAQSLRFLKSKKRQYDLESTIDCRPTGSLMQYLKRQIISEYRLEEQFAAQGTDADMDAFIEFLEKLLTEI